MGGRTSGWGTHLKRKIDTGWISNFFISFLSAEAENQKVPGMHFAARIVQIEGRACQLLSMIPPFDRAQLDITGHPNQELGYRVYQS